jgi:hypothetical protein
MNGHAERANRFLALHQGELPLLLPNPWDRGSARLAWLGFQALATDGIGEHDAEATRPRRRLVDRSHVLPIEHQPSSLSWWGGCRWSWGPSRGSWAGFQQPG